MKVRRVDALMKLLLLPRVTSLPCIVIPLTQPIIERCNYTESIISNRPTVQRRFLEREVSRSDRKPSHRPILGPELTLPPLSLSTRHVDAQTFQTNSRN